MAKSTKVKAKKLKMKKSSDKKMKSSIKVSKTKKKSDDTKPKKKLKVGRVTKASAVVKASGKKSKKVDVEVGGAAAVHTKSRTDKSKMPSILQSKAFLELNNYIDREEKKLNISRTDMHIGGHLSDAISTGILTLDLVNGGGYQPGRLIVHPGVEMAGKSTGIVTSLANAFSNDIPAILADTENTFDTKYADKAMSRFNMSIDNMLGIYNKKKGCWEVPPMLRIIQENNGEAVFLLMQRAMRSMPIINRDQDGAWWAVTKLLNKDGSIKSESAVEHDGKPQMFFYIDSFAAMIPDILDSDDEKETIGAQALMFTRKLPKTCKLLKERNCILVGTNQLRAKIGGFTRVGMPPPMDMPGGNSLKFNTAVRTFFAPIAPTTAGWGKSDKEYVEEESITGGVDRYKFIGFRNKKHKSATPLRSGFARIRYMHDGLSGDGFDESFDVYEFLHSTGQASKRGSTISLDIAPVKANGKEPNIPLDPHAKKVSWAEFKRAVEAPEHKHRFFNFCREQIKSGYVFTVEQERVTNKSTGSLQDEDTDE